MQRITKKYQRQSKICCSFMRMLDKNFYLTKLLQREQREKSDVSKGEWWRDEEGNGRNDYVSKMKRKKRTVAWRGVAWRGGRTEVHGVSSCLYSGGGIMLALQPGYTGRLAPASDGKAGRVIGSPEGMEVGGGTEWRGVEGGGVRGCWGEEW